MKIRFWIAVAFVAALSSVANAAPRKPARVEKLQFFSATNPRKTLPLRENKTLRKIALSQMPRGGISNFFGACKGRFRKGANAAYLAANVYAMPKDDPKTPRREYSLWLDVFAYSTKTARLMRLQRLDLTQKLKCIYGNWSQGNDSAGVMDLMWLDANLQQAPLLRMNMGGTVMSGIAGCYGLIVFPNGLRAAPVVQDFETSDNMMGSQNIFFDTRGKNGFLILRQDVNSLNIGFDEQHPTTTKLEKRTYFDWDGKAFVARSSKKRASKPR